MRIDDVDDDENEMEHWICWIRQRTHIKLHFHDFSNKEWPVFWIISIVRKDSESERSLWNVACCFICQLKWQLLLKWL